MLKYENKVSRLDERQKIELLTNIVGMSESELISLGLPAIKVGRLAEITKNIYPAPEMIANSWNDELAFKLGRSGAELSLEKGINLALTPSAKVKLDPYGRAMSEDVCLSSALAYSYASGARSTGIGVCVEGMGVSRDEVKWLGNPPDRRVIYEYIVRPYQLARKSEDIAIGVQRDLRREGFDEIGAEIAGAMRGSVGATRLICESAGASDTVRMINRQIICLQGAGYALSAALRKYDIIKKAVDKGELEEDELLSEIECGDAISPEMLDEAVDRLIDLLESCAALTSHTEGADKAADELAYRATAESAVLLKNEARTLPIAKRKKIALIGDVAFCGCHEFLDTLTSALEASGATVVGRARGYALETDAPDTELTAEALELAKHADILLFFVGTDGEREKYVANTKNLSLPANQDMLARELKRSGKTTVALLDCRCSVDIAAIEQLSALMVLSCASVAAARACADLLTGEINPSGKLASTLYRNTDRSFSRREHQLGREVSVGRFIGYRYYDSADYDVGFSFGHGLSYTRFDYSAITVEKGGAISLTVKNTGKRDGAEVVQIYAGLDDRTALCPKKELVAYKKIFLRAGESAKLSFELGLPRVLDESSGEMVVRKGRYTVYAGSSLSDIRRSTKINSDGTELQSPNEPLARYLLCESNIITDNYTLEAKYPIMKRAIKNIISGVAMLLVALLLQVYCVSTNTASAFLNILTVIILGIAVVFFVLDALDRKRMADNERALAEKENEKWFEDATRLESFDTEKMFEEEFSEEESEVEEEEEQMLVADVADEYLAYIDKDLTLARTAEELSAFALERGCKLERRSVYTLLSALSSSRLVILNGIRRDEFSALAGVLCEYLECNFHMDIADSSYMGGESVFMRSDENGNKVKSGALRTLEEAGASQSELHVAPIANVSVEMLTSCFGDIVKYAKNPSLPSLVTSVEGKYRFSKNILFLIGLDSERTLAELPASVAEVATVCEPKLTLIDRAATLSSSGRLKLYQLEYMADQVAAEELVGEENWKKLDAFEGYVGERTGYTIGNKRWISIERYASVYTSAGGEVTEALDEAIASRLLPSVISACRGKEISLGETIENIFGENEMDCSCRAIRNSRLYAKDQGETNV